MSERKPYGYWKSLDNILRECRDVMKEHNFQILPSGPTLKKLGRGDLAKGLDNNFSAAEIRKALGEENVVEYRDMGYWKKRENILAQAKEFLENNPQYETIPSGYILAKLGYSSLAGAIYKHGGAAVLREELRLPAMKRRVEGLLKEEEYMFAQAKRIIEDLQVTHIPSSSKLRQLGYRGFLRGIRIYHGGMKTFRSRFESTMGIAPQQDLESVLKEYVA